MLLYVHCDDLDRLLKTLTERKAKKVTLHGTLDDFRIVNWVASASPSRIGDMPVFVYIKDGLTARYIQYVHKGNWVLANQYPTVQNLTRLRNLWISETLKHRLGVT